MVGGITALALACSCWATGQGLTDVELLLLARAVRMEAASIRLAGLKRPEAMKRAAEALVSRPPEAWRMELLRALAGLRGIEWTEAHRAAAACAFFTGETAVEPGAALHAALEPMVQSETPAAGVLSGWVSIRGADGRPVSLMKPQDVRDLLGRELHLRAPKEEGRYAVTADLKDANSGQVVASGRKTLWVVADLRRRVSGVRTRAESLALKAEGPAAAVWINTVLAIAERYQPGGEPAGRHLPEVASPLVQTLVSAAGAEPMDPAADLAWAERALEAIAAGRTAAEPGAWNPIAARSHQDQSLRLARVWWPREAAAGLALLLGDTLAHERTWTDVEPGKLLALAPAQRVQGGGWGGAAWEDIEDWLAAIRQVSGAEKLPLYVLMHGAGAEEGLSQAQKTPPRFAGLAVIAGQSQQPLQSIPKDFPPVMLVEAGKDALVPADAVRRAGLLFQRRLRAFEYALFAEEDHEAVRAAAAPRAFAFFEALAAGVWKPSAQPVPLPGGRAQ
jgi:hypothetical protein